MTANFPGLEKEYKKPESTLVDSGFFWLKIAADTDVLLISYNAQPLPDQGRHRLFRRTGKPHEFAGFVLLFILERWSPLHQAEDCR